MGRYNRTRVSAYRCGLLSAAHSLANTAIAMSVPGPLDSPSPCHYSFSFRTHSLKVTMQRLVGSVGVEALRRLVIISAGLTNIVA